MPEMVGGLVFVCVFVSVNFAHGGLFPYQYIAFKKFILLSVIPLMHRNSEVEADGVFSQRRLLIASTKEVPERRYGPYGTLDYSAKLLDFKFHYQVKA